MRLVESNRKVVESKDKPFGLLTNEEFIRLAYASNHSSSILDVAVKVMVDDLSNIFGKDFAGDWEEVYYHNEGEGRFRNFYFKDYGSYDELKSAVKASIKKK